jgi:hypothetical protein
MMMAEVEAKAKGVASLVGRARASVSVVTFQGRTRPQSRYQLLFAAFVAAPSTFTVISWPTDRDYCAGIRIFMVYLSTAFIRLMNPTARRLGTSARRTAGNS